MREISRMAASAFSQKRPFKKGNTEVVVGEHETFLYLYGEMIARDGNKFGLWVQIKGHREHACIERLNALPYVEIHRKGERYTLNGSVWSGKWVKVYREGFVEVENRGNYGIVIPREALP